METIQLTEEHLKIKAKIQENNRIAREKFKSQPTGIEQSMTAEELIKLVSREI